MTDYTELNEQQLESLKRHLAEKVMGWKATGEAGEIGLTSQTPIPPNYYDPISCEGKGLVKDFDPLNNIEQVMWCLDTFMQWECGFNVYSKQYYCHVWFNDLSLNHLYAYSKDSLGMAIGLACAKATGWEE